MSSQFTFVPVDVTKKNKRDLVAPDDRLMIRSLAARNPWNRPTEGEKITPGVRRRRTNKGLPTRAPKPKEKDHSKSKSKGKAKAKEPRSRRSSSSSSESLEDEEASNQFVLPHRETSPSRQTSSEAIIKSESDSSLDSPSLPNHILSDQIDPFWSFSVPFHPVMPPILNHRLNVLSRFVPSLDTSPSRSESPKWALNQLFIMHKDAPPFLYATLLFAGAHLQAGGTTQNIHAQYALANSTTEAISGQEHLLWLKGLAINSLNEYLSDETLVKQPKKLAATLASVSILANFEFYFGDRDVHSMHIQGSRRLVELCGGLNYIDELSKRFYMFILKTYLMGPRDGSRGGGPGVTEFGVVVSIFRDLFRAPATRMGYDLDALIEADES